MGDSADIVLVGGGAGGLQLSVEALRLFERHGFGFSVGAPPTLTALLTTSGVELESLDELVAQHDEPADGLLAAADVILKQVAIERPVLVLVPGNPLFLNSLSRFLLAEGQRRELTVERIAGTSALDVVVNELGIDVGARGLQVFDAASIVAGRSDVSPTVPAVILGVGGVAAAGSYARFAELLADRYPAEHPVTLVNLDPNGDTSHATGPLASLGEFAEHVHSGSSFFVGPVHR